MSMFGDADKWMHFAADAIVVLPALWIYYRKARNSVLMYLLAQINAVKKEITPNGGNTNSLGDLNVKQNKKLETLERSVLTMQDLFMTMQKNFCEIVESVKSVQNEMDRWIRHSTAGTLYKSRLRLEVEQRLGVEVARQMFDTVEGSMHADYVVDRSKQAGPPAESGEV